MKRIKIICLAFSVLFMLSVFTACAQYVKAISEDGTVSWIKIVGTINGTNIEISRCSFTSGSIDLNEVWSESDGKGTHYQVTSIRTWAFNGHGNLTFVEIPSSVTSIEERAFDGCGGLTSVVIPSSVTSIGNGAFQSCSNLTSIVVESGNSVYDSRNNCNAIIETASNTLIAGCKNTKIPSSVTSIGYAAFSGCSGLTSVTIPSSVTSIGNYAFSGCSGLFSVVIPSNVTSIGNGAFQRCSNLTLVVIPFSVTSIGAGAFQNCIGLTSITIPSSVTSIGAEAFQYCIGLTSITIPSSVTSIGARVFSNCRGLMYIVIPTSVTSIEESAFEGCCNLTSVEIPSSVTSISSSAFSGCSGLTSVEIPSSVTSIGTSAFYNCIGLTSIVVESGNSVYDSRNNCNAIIKTSSNTLIAGCKNSMIPSSVRSIGEGAFSGCSGLTSVEIPSSVTSIGNYAFSGCSGLTSITSYITKVFKTGTKTFSGCDNATLYVTSGLISTYRSTADWNSISKIEEMSGIALAISCNNKGKVMINQGVQISNKVGKISVYDGVDNTFVFTPEENCELEQVLIDGLDVTKSVKNNQLTTKIHEGSKMIVTFSKSSGDMNGDGMVNISDVVALVNLILGQ